MGRTAASDLRPRYHYVTRIVIEYRYEAWPPPTTALASRLKKTLLLPFHGIFLFLPFILALFYRIIPELKLIMYSHIANVLGSLELCHSCMGRVNAII